MKKIVLTLCAALICTVALSAQAQQAPAAPKPTAAAAPSVAGSWNMSLDAGQGPMDIAVTMKLDGKKVTGMLSSQMGDVALAGETADGEPITADASLAEALGLMTARRTDRLSVADANGAVIGVITLADLVL